MPSLNRQQKAKCQVSFILVIVSLLLEQARKEANEETPNAAVSECAAMIDTLVKSTPEGITRNEMLRRINLARVRLTKRTADLTTTSAVIGSLRLLTGGYVKSRPGTRLNYIIDTFKANLPGMEAHLTFKEQDAAKFKSMLKEATARIG